MAKFSYRGYDQHGGRVDGVVEAETHTAAKQILENRHVIIVSLEEERAKKTLSISSINKVTLDQLELFTAEMSILLENGVRIDKCLNVLGKNKGQGPIERVISELAESIKRGNSLSDAMANHPKTFDFLYLNLVKIGEASGTLPLVFSRLAMDLKFKSDLRKKITQALTYPFVIFTVCVACVLFIFNYIVPQMSGLFDGVQDLPIYTTILLNLSSWVRDYQFFILIGLLLCGAGLYSAWQNTSLRQRIDDSLLQIPLLKSALILTDRIRFSSALSMMLVSGISIDKALDFAVDCVRNRTLRQDLVSAKEQIKKGASLTEELSKSPIFPDFVSSLLEVGEESGRLETIFDEVSSRSRQDFDSWTAKMTSLLEPLLILTMGFIVGSVVVVMLLSIMSVNDLGG